jgi:hypothetical protein
VNLSLIVKQNLKIATDILEECAASFKTEVKLSHKGKTVNNFCIFIPSVIFCTLPLCGE